MRYKRSPKQYSNTVIVQQAELQNVNFLHRSFLSILIYPKKKRANRDKFLTFKALNGHKKQILGQIY